MSTEEVVVSCARESKVRPHHVLASGVSAARDGIHKVDMQATVHRVTAFIDKNLNHADTRSAAQTQQTSMPVGASSLVYCIAVLQWMVGGQRLLM